VGLSLGHHIVEPFLKEITALGKSNVLVFSFGMAIMANQLPKGCKCFRGNKNIFPAWALSSPDSVSANQLKVTFIRQAKPPKKFRQE